MTEDKTKTESAARDGRSATGKSDRKAAFRSAETPDHGREAEVNETRQPLPPAGGRASRLPELAAMAGWVFRSWLRPAGTSLRWEQKR